MATEQKADDAARRAESLVQSEKFIEVVNDMDTFAMEPLIADAIRDAVAVAVERCARIIEERYVSISQQANDGYGNLVDGESLALEILRRIRTDIEV